MVICSEPVSDQAKSGKALAVGYNECFLFFPACSNKMR